MIERVTDWQHIGVISLIFVAKSMEEKERVLVDFALLNQMIGTVKFTQENLKQAVAQVKKDDFFMKLDLKSVYHAIAVNVTCCKFLRMMWKGEMH